MNLNDIPDLSPDQLISTSENYDRNRKYLQDEIQRTYNRIHYDRTIDEFTISGLKKTMEELELDLSNLSKDV